MCLLHDNACPHTSNAVKQLLDSFGWDTINYPTHSSDLAPSEFHFVSFLQLFTSFLLIMRSRVAWKNRPSRRRETFLIRKLNPPITKCIKKEGDYIKEIVFQVRLWICKFLINTLPFRFLKNGVLSLSGYVSYVHHLNSICHYQTMVFPGRESSYLLKHTL